jgi:hypothetical protein
LYPLIFTSDYFNPLTSISAGFIAGEVMDNIYYKPDKGYYRKVFLKCTARWASEFSTKEAKLNTLKAWNFLLP